jgi:hypothetical protein
VRIKISTEYAWGGTEARNPGAGGLDGGQNRLLDGTGYQSPAYSECDVTCNSIGNVFLPLFGLTVLRQG